ncbi:MAG: winged helix-turn-helix transcriptional regulator [Candidatus Micrarchaeota archaeon]
MDCETAVKETLPAVRALLTKELHDAGLPQAEIAEKLGIKQPAVSRYLKQSRGLKAKTLMKDKSIRKFIKKSAADIAGGRKFAFCSACKTVRSANKCCG